MRSTEQRRHFRKMQQNFLISANSFVQRAGIEALSKEGEEAVAKMRAVYDKRRKLMVELMREVGFGIPVMPQGAFYVYADASRWTDDSYEFAFELLEKSGVGAPGIPTAGYPRSGSGRGSGARRGLRPDRETEAAVTWSRKIDQSGSQGRRD